jgi:hypothetical protein
VADIEFAHAFQHRVHRRRIVRGAIQRSPAQQLQLVLPQPIADALWRQRHTVGIETAVARERQLRILQAAGG